jgi:hypothetical protein
MSRDHESETGLPIGATLLERAPFEPSKEIALELARRGVSKNIVELVAGGPDELGEVLAEMEEIVSTTRAASTNGNGSHPTEPAAQ